MMTPRLRMKRTWFAPTISGGIRIGQPYAQITLNSMQVEALVAWLADGRPDQRIRNADEAAA